MARYMRTDLTRDLESINADAKNAGRNTYLYAQGRNGYTGLDEYNNDGRLLRTIKCGTPRECYTAALEWAR